jgi:GT2 family glycosyltransferase
VNKNINSTFDILCASFYRPSVFKKLLDFLVKEKVDELVSVIVLVHSEDKETNELIDQYNDLLCLDIIRSEQVLSPGKTRNKLISHSRSDYILFFDDDIVPCCDYFKKAMEILKDESLDVLGGPDQAYSEEGRKQVLVSSVLSSPFVSGATYQRHSVETEKKLNASELQLTLCNLWLKRSLVLKLDYYFDDQIGRAEECDLLNRLSERGALLSYHPELFVYHYRRVELLDLLKIHYIAGKARVSIILKNKSNFHSFFLIPLITGFSLPFLIIFEPVTLLSLVIIHLALSFLSIIRLGKARGISEMIYSYLVIAVIHLGFSIGMTSGTIFYNARK